MTARLVTVLDGDKVAVLERGRLVEEGSPKVEQTAGHWHTIISVQELLLRPGSTFQEMAALAGLLPPTM